MIFIVRGLFRLIYCPEGLENSPRGFNPISANLLDLRSRADARLGRQWQKSDEDEDEFEDDYD